MNILFVLIGVSILIAIFFLVVFVYSVKKGQYDDTYSPAHRILFDDIKKNKPKDVKISTFDNQEDKTKR